MNLLYRCRCWVVSVSIACLFSASSGYAETDDEYLLKMQQLVTQGETGVGLFPIQIPGETFAAERSQIGHAVSDFTLSGNGLASFDLVRKYQDSPAVEPYVFGNMSIELPTLIFRAKLDGRNDLAHNMSCTHLSAQGVSGKDWTVHPDKAVSELYNDVQFTTASSNIRFLPRALVNTGYLSNYPDNALLVSKDNYYIKCDGAFYVLYAPDGTSYHFSAATGADRIISSTTTTDNTGNETTHNFRTYRIRAAAIKRHNSTINLNYETNPTITVYGEDRHVRARTPLAPTRTNIIDTPKRLKSVVLVAAHDTNPGLPEFHALDIEYQSHDDANCPGLIENIRQTYQSSPSAGIALIHQKRYEYRKLNLSEQALIAAPRSACLLSKVKHADEVGMDSGVFIDLWDFSYGATNSGQSDGLVVTGREGVFHTEKRNAWNTSKIFDRTYIPLREVITPTNTRVVYEYTGLKPCEYQSFRGETADVPCNNSKIVILALEKRTVHYQSGGQFTSQETMFETIRHNAEQYQTWIKNNEIWHRLVFGRSFLDEEGPAGSESLNVTANEKFLKAGRLLAHELRLPSGSILTNSTFEYKENGVFPLAHDSSRGWFDYPEDGDHWNGGDQGWGWKNARRAYLLSHRRVNRYKTTTEVDGDTYVNAVNSTPNHPTGYDEYNQPKTVSESYTTRAGVWSSRQISYSYDHDYGSKYGWYVGLLAEVRRHNGAEAMVDSRTYNSSGLMSSRSNAGIYSQYQYHLNGNLKASINGNNHATNYSAYKFGVATTIASPENGLVTRVVDVRGNITQESTRKDGSLFNGMVYEYKDPFSRVSKIEAPDEVLPIEITYPNWRAYQWDKLETRGDQQAVTHYDSLGRVDYAGTRDLGNMEQRFVNTVYDSQGRVKLTSDPSIGGGSQEGVEFQYDDLGRVTSSRHTSDPAFMLYCYGSDCAASSNNGMFNGAGAVKNGYAVRDQKGAVTVYNFEAYGSPMNAQLVEIRQEIQPASGYMSSDTVVVTDIERNKVGFVTRISQSGNNTTNVLHRDYTPYIVNGSLTMLTKTEKHPEFDGVKTVDAYDGVGNPTRVTNFDGSEHTYTYDNKERLVYHTTPASTDDINSAGTLAYTYFDNDSLRTISSSDSVWTYDYNANNLLSDATLDFAGESFDTGFHYDTALNLSQIDYPSGQSVMFESNGFGEQVSAGDYLSSAAYHLNGYLKSMTLASGETYSTQQNTRKRVKNINVSLANGQGSAASPLSLTYAYTNRGNVESITGYFNASNQQSSSLLNLQYDGLSRLHQATGDWGTQNSAANIYYDALGNIQRRLVGGVNLNYTYNPSTNKLVSASFSGDVGLNYNRLFTYDGNGNIVSDGVKDFTYDHLNRLVNAVTDGTTVQANTYDGHGHRVRMIVNDGQRVRTTFFVYDPSGNLLHEFDKESGEQRDHIRFNGRTIATKSFHQNHDSDGDGMPDYFERTFGLPVFNTANAQLDSDNDGLTDLVEFQLGQIPTNMDSNGDGATDGAEYPSYVLATPPGTPGPNGVILTPIFEYLEGL